MLGVTILLLLFISIVIGSEFIDYNNQEKWPGTCRTGKQQSPIGITSDATTNRVFSSIILSNFDQVLEVNFTFTGTTIGARFGNASVYIAEGGPFTTRHRLDRFQFHWPSEHTLEQKQSRLEVHFFMTPMKSRPMSDLESGDISIMSTLFNIVSEEKSQYLNALVTELGKLDTVNSSVAVRFKLAALFPDDLQDFFVYTGSLTTPPCHESVTWIVFRKHLAVSSKQIRVFDSLRLDDHKLGPNNRDLRPTDGRIIYYNNFAQTCEFSFCFLLHVITVHMVYNFGNFY